jgi:Tol biopolymer transport system component
VSKQGSGKFGIFTMRADGSGREKILGPGGDFFGVGVGSDERSGSNPSWSPDGTKLVYEGWSTIKKQSADASTSPIPLVGCGCHEKYFLSSDWQLRP